MEVANDPLDRRVVGVRDTEKEVLASDIAAYAAGSIDTSTLLVRLLGVVMEPTEVNDTSSTVADDAGGSTGSVPSNAMRCGITKMPMSSRSASLRQSTRLQSPVDNQKSRGVTSASDTEARRGDSARCNCDPCH